MARRNKPRPPVERVGDQFVINLGTDERELVSRLLGELRDLLLGATDQPLLRRMFPPAYHLADDADADAEYQRLMHDDLVASRLAAISGVLAVLGNADATRRVDEEGLIALMQALNALRLVLGTLLDVSEEDHPDDIDDDDPLVGEYHLYGYLSYLLDEAVDALTG